MLDNTSNVEIGACSYGTRGRKGGKVRIDERRQGPSNSHFWLEECYTMVCHVTNSIRSDS